MAIGNFGKKIIFEVSSKKILTFENFKRENTGRWATHPRIGKEPLRQFLGPDATVTTFTIRLDARHGVKPRKTIDTIVDYVKKGTPDTLVIGGKKVGTTKQTINSISQTWDEVWNRGELVRATVEITMQNYP